MLLLVHTGDPYVAADFNTGGIENSNNPFVTYPLTANAAGTVTDRGLLLITTSQCNNHRLFSLFTEVWGMKLTGNANGDSTTTNPNWAAEGTTTTVNKFFWYYF
jgi:hypothetical protein